MKKPLSILLIAVGFFAAGTNLPAFDRPSIERLIRTRKCPGCDFYRAKLDRLDLTGVNLRRATLAYASFREATLYNADLSGADLRGTIFDGAVWVDGSICQQGSVGTCRRKSN